MMFTKSEVMAELERRRTSEQTYTRPLGIEAAQADNMSELQDFMKDFHATFLDRERERQRENVLEQHPDVAAYYRDLVPVEVSEEEFWQRYHYRCCEERIFRELNGNDDNASNAAASNHSAHPVVAKLQNAELQEHASSEVVLRRRTENTYTQPLGTASEDLSELKDFMKNFYATFYSREHKRGREDVLEQHSDVADHYHALVPVKVSEEEFWQRYEYRCDRERILRWLDRTAKSQRAALVEKEMKRRRSLEDTYTKQLGAHDDELSGLKDFMKEFYTTFYNREQERKRKQILEQYPDVATHYHVLVPIAVSEEEFWQRYEYRCDPERIICDYHQSPRLPEETSTSLVEAPNGHKESEKSNISLATVSEPHHNEKSKTSSLSSPAPPNASHSPFHPRSSTPSASSTPFKIPDDRRASENLSARPKSGQHPVRSSPPSSPRKGSRVLSSTEQLNVYVQIKACRDLAIDERSADTFVKVKMGSKDVHETRPIMNTKKPHFREAQRNIFILKCSASELLGSKGLTFIACNYTPKTIDDDDFPIEEIGRVRIPSQAIIKPAGDLREYKLRNEDTLETMGYIRLKIRNATGEDRHKVSQLQRSQSVPVHIEVLTPTLPRKPKVTPNILPPL